MFCPINQLCKFFDKFHVCLPDGQIISNLILIQISWICVLLNKTVVCWHLPWVQTTSGRLLDIWCLHFQTRWSLSACVLWHSQKLFVQRRTLQVALFPFKVKPRPVRYPTTFTRSKIHKVLLIRCFCSCCLVLCGFALSQWKRCKAWGSIVGLSTTYRSYDLCLNTSMCFKFNSQWNKSVKGPDLFFLFCHLGLW